MPITQLTADQIRRTCDPASFSFETTAELSFADEIFGQPRAIRAIEFGIHMDAPGYNVFIVGSPGTGRMPAVQRYLAQHAPNEPAPNDWVYVQNFADAYRPIALQLTRGKARAFAPRRGAASVQPSLTPRPHPFRVQFKSRGANYPGRRSCR